MSTQKKRSYADLLKRLSKTLDNTVQIITLDHIKYSNNKYPFQKIILGVHNREANSNFSRNSWG